MRLRPILWALALVAGFVYITSNADWSVRRILRPIQTTGRLWSAPGVARTASFGSDEQNNIDIYRMANAATVNISSIVYKENWFLQVYPERGQGSGFIVDDESRALPAFGVNLQEPVFLVDDAGDIHRGGVGNAINVDVILLVRSEGGGTGYLRRRPQASGAFDGLEDAAHAPVRLRSEIDKARDDHQGPQNG